ncbi:hypothetical protein PHYPSEUDO_005997 [Phytophthora pseudosyringae]|uniref:Uncharacterized protein n=1 Tax=Phytophthora pseudosyringae TaxID=221518 RepID=A0A8T1VJM0_9STRA|nr:hypothetical protein PHYPSEUDO_005997 [Phytophthora pseudosyringae]
MPILNSQSTEELADITNTRGVSDSSIYSDEELDEIDAKSAFVIPSIDRLTTIKADAIRAMGPASEEMQSCCICELGCTQTDVIEMRLTDEFTRRMACCLSVPKGVPAAIIAQYSATHLDRRLNDLLLFPAGRCG